MRVLRLSAILVVAACSPAKNDSSPVVVPIGASSSAPIASMSEPPPPVPARGYLARANRLEETTGEDALAAIRKAPSRGVARAVLATADCSSVGAHHLLLALERDRDTREEDARAWLKTDLAGLPFSLATRSGDAGAAFAGRFVDGWFVVGLVRHERAPLPAPCVKDQHYDAVVTAILPVADAAEGERLLRVNR